MASVRHVGTMAQQQVQSASGEIRWLCVHQPRRQNFMTAIQRITVLLLMATLAACASQTTVEPSPQVTAPAPKTNTLANRYDHQSWKSLISDSCQAYFDGCNQCRRALDSTAVACTRKACTQYQKPYCLDPNSGPHWRQYQCADGRALAVYFGEYRTAAIAITLPCNKLVLEDRLNQSSHTLSHSVSASGSLYRDDNVSFWVKGTNARYTPAAGSAIRCEQSARGSFGEY